MDRNNTPPVSHGESFSYTLIRVSPRVERGESINTGIVLYCPAHRYLHARVVLNATRLRALSPNLDTVTVNQHLQAVVDIAAGHPAGGPIAQLSQSERFHWLSAPRSTIIQPSKVHTGITNEPAQTLDRLFHDLVAADLDIELAVTP